MKGNGAVLEVQEIFHTLQGEGPHAGTPAVFVRLGGCNLACGFCDTEFESFAVRSLEAVVAEVGKQAGEGTRLVVITGGEPLRQPIAPLCEALLEAGYGVQIETNGTLYRPLPAAVEMVCSPKPGKRGYAPLREDVLVRATALKFLVSADRAFYRSVPDVGQSRKKVPVYIQPIDEHDPARNAANQRHAVTLALHHGYRLSLQWHKVLGLR